MYTQKQTLYRVAMTAIAVTLLSLNLACGGGGGGDGSFIADMEIQQIADANNIPVDDTKGIVAVDTSQVTTSSVRASAVVGTLTVLLYVDGSPLDVPEAMSEDGKIIVFFNVPPGDVQLRITRDEITVFSRDITDLAAGQTVEIRAAEEPTNEAEALALRAMTNLLSATPDMATAAADFDAALAKDGNNDLALMGSALTGMTLLGTTSAEIQNILSTLGYENFNPNALLPQVGGELATQVAQAAAVAGADVQDVIDSTLLPAIQAALDKLAKIGSDFVQGIGGIEVDYSDVLAARASLMTLKGLLQTANAYDANTPDLSGALITDTLGTVLETEPPPLGTVRDTARLTAAKSTLASAIDASIAFIDALQAESDIQTDDLIQKADDTQDIADVAAVKRALQDTKASLQGSSTSIRVPNEEFGGACTDTAQINLAAVFAGGLNDLRDIETDQTNGGLFPGSTDGHAVTTNDCPTTADAVNGATLYEACTGCHGADGTGGTVSEWINGADAGDIIEAVAEVPEMASLSLTAQEAADIAAYLGN